MGTFDNVEQAPPDAIFAVLNAFKADTDSRKINLSVGAYRTDEGTPWVLPTVAKVEGTLKNVNHEYLPIDGNPVYNAGMRDLALGKDSIAIKEERTCAVQMLSGTGALRIAAEFISKFHQSKTILVSTPTWGNHNAIFKRANLDILPYRYYKAETRGLDFEGMIADLEAAPEHSTVLLHACAHNPTGVDPTNEQWAQIAVVMKQKGHFPLFDCAYQGFMSGNLADDAFAIRYFVEQGFECLVCQSCSKNFGLYNERAGCLTAVLSTKEAAAAVLSQLKILVRSSYSNPPNHGAAIVANILSDASLYKDWEDDLNTMSGRILSMRQQLHDAIVAKGATQDWSHMLKQRGMFTFTGLTPAQVERLTSEFHVYLLKNGRINMCGVNSHNIDYLANAIVEVTK
ncbi:aspartate aminotransferase, cytoplasmic [Sphaeroforma arctica JP610]|uniref:Aspartate aminotransferase n=1 Tax=Sphaeroforma arctica JP610 TaxID=667725 RepID=A0A0L0FGY8_9EUKA|nr:aspartate aminotransferase, cytoplasmic [Sphaeroforma arctica JP610]KNC75313.1 aspartate aminotransferase, cytoplasmic [Sphaeroforma arctica JP610]|eukprot:XP_014149215.1 aspartate aminotransferase, cytoplasmic [Sphaeroforma arctica JP610]